MRKLIGIIVGAVLLVGAPDAFSAPSYSAILGEAALGSGHVLEITVVPEIVERVKILPPGSTAWVDVDVSCLAARRYQYGPETGTQIDLSGAGSDDEEWFVHVRLPDSPTAGNIASAAIGHERQPLSGNPCESPLRPVQLLIGHFEVVWKA